MRQIAYVFSMLSLSGTVSSLCFAATAVSPSLLANQEGARESGEWPPASRGMSVYARSLFDAGGTPTVRITSFNLRPDGRHPVGARFGFDNLKLTFAITPRDTFRLRSSHPPVPLQDRSYFAAIPGVPRPHSGCQHHASHGVRRPVDRRGCQSRSPRQRHSTVRF